MKRTIAGLVVMLMLAACSGGHHSDSGTIQNNTDMEHEMAKRNKKSAKAFFTALEDENIAALTALFATGARHINPYASGIFPTGAEGREGIRKYWEPVFPNFDGMTFDIEQIYAMEDPTMVFVKYTGRIKLKNNAGHYENNYYSTFRFDDSGLITEYVEIFNPIVAARGFGLIDQIK